MYCTLDCTVVLSVAWELPRLLCCLAMWQKDERVEIQTTSDCFGMFQLEFEYRMKEKQSYVIEI